MWTFTHAGDKYWNLLKRKNTKRKAVGVMGGSRERPYETVKFKERAESSQEQGAHQWLCREKAVWGLGKRC